MKPLYKLMFFSLVTLSACNNENSEVESDVKGVAITESKKVNIEKHLENFKEECSEEFNALIKLNH